MQWETMFLEGRGPLRHLVFNRPQRHNAINRQFLDDVVQACLAVEALPDCRVLIVRGAGPSFSSGADLKEALTHQGTLQQMLSRSKAGARAVQALGDLTPITIAALHGHVIGGGALLALACDFRVAADSTRLCVREVGLGISLSWEGIPTVVNAVGPARAKEMILFAEEYGAQKMLEYGAYNQVVPEARVLEATLALAQRVLAQPPLPVQMTKASINAYTRALARAVFHADAVGLALTGRSQDAAAARDAYFSGTPVDWKAE